MPKSTNQSTSFKNEDESTNTHMELQRKNTSMESQDDNENVIQRNHISLGGVVTVNDTHLETNCDISMSNEESRIRAELEADIERDLEEEIKDGIRRLAFRLHRLYERQRDRNARESSRSGNKAGSAFDNKKTFSEVNITIKMEGDSKIEINEIKKVAHEKQRPRTSYSSEGKKGNIFPGKIKKFNWVNTLRSENRLHPVVKNVHRVHTNTKHEVKGGRNCKRPVKVANAKLLELGWRS